MKFLLNVKALNLKNMKKIITFISLFLVVLTTSAQFPAPYCTITYPAGVEPISSVSFAGASSTSSETLGGQSLQNFTSSLGTVTQGLSYSMVVRGNTNGANTNYIRVFIDWNRDGDFLDPSETYNIGTLYNSSGTIFSTPVSGNILVPLHAMLGTGTRMRVTKHSITYQNPCNSSGAGQSEDYTLEVLAAPTCSGVPIGGTSIGPNSACAANPIDLSLSGQTNQTGITYQWQKTNTGGSSWSNISGANSASVTIAFGTVSTDYRCLVSCASGSSAASSIKTVNLQTTNCSPENDNFCNAKELRLNATAECQDNTNATSINDPELVFNTTSNTTWFKYTPTNTGIYQLVMTRPTGVTTGLLAGYIGIYTPIASCPLMLFSTVTGGGFFDLTTNISTTITTPTLTSGTEYFFMVDGFNNAVGQYCIQLKTPPPINDQCANAIIVTNSATAGTYNGSTVNATSSTGIPKCSPSTGDDDDVWYKFTASENGNANITVTGSTGFDPVVNFLSGSCGSLSSIACYNATGSGGVETISQTGLTSGQVYFIRVYSLSTTVGGTFTMTLAGTALPVNIVEFKGERISNENILTWTTTIESNNVGFEIQRSADGKNFSPLYFIKSQSPNGNSSSNLNYWFKDAKPLEGENFYHLKQIDKNGKITLSHIIAIKGIKSNKLILKSIYPNPVKDCITISVIAPKAENAILLINDIAGRVVVTKNLILKEGNNNLELNISSITSGQYFAKLIVTGGRETVIEKFVKQ